MKRKTQITILMLLLVVFCLCVFASCNQQKADYFTYSEENLGVLGKFVKLMHEWIGNYGWTVVVFTVFLKVGMLPLDLWQRVSSRKSAIKMQKLQPLMQEIDKRYGANSPKANEEKQKLYKKQGYSAFSMCLPMIISMVIFFVMFGGLREYSTYSSITNFQELSDTYITSYYDAVEGNEREFLVKTYESLKSESAATSEKAAEVNARLRAIDMFQNEYGFDHCSTYREKALDAVSEYYKGHHESWLWIDNVWQPDTWVTVMPAFNDRTNGFSATVNMEGLGVGDGQAHYELIRSAVLKTGGHGANGTWNGLMLLPFMSVLLSFASIFISQFMDKRVRKGDNKPEQNAQQKASNTMMLIIMPLMMAFFGFQYTGAFAIYMVANYLLSIISTVALYVPVERMVQKSIAKLDNKEKSNKASYMR